MHPRVLYNSTASDDVIPLTECWGAWSVLIFTSKCFPCKMMGCREWYGCSTFWPLPPTCKIPPGSRNGLCTIQLALSKQVWHRDKSHLLPQCSEKFLIYFGQSEVLKLPARTPLMHSQQGYQYPLHDSSDWVEWDPWCGRYDCQHRVWNGMGSHTVLSVQAKTESRDRLSTSFVWNIIWANTTEFRMSYSYMWQLWVT